MKILIWLGCIAVYSVVVTACRFGGVTFGALPTILLALIFVILPAKELCRRLDKNREGREGPVRREAPEEISEEQAAEIKNPALRARAELYRNSAGSDAEPEKKPWPAPGEKLCGTPFIKAGEKIPGAAAPEPVKKRGRTRLEVILAVACAALVITSAVLGYKVYEFRGIVIAFVSVNDELLHENKSLESEVEELQREVSSMSSGSSDVDDFTRRYLELREQRLGTSYYVASVNSDIYHRSSCDYVDNILEENRTYYLSKLRAIIDGKQPCSVCMP